MPSKYIRNAAGEFVCPDCGITKARQNTMYYHMKTHAAEQEYKCPDCPMQFPQKQSLERHMHAKHPAVPTPAPTDAAASATAAAPIKSSLCTRFACPYPECTFQALSKGNCRVHVFRIHYGDISKSYASPGLVAGTTDCELCNTTFNSPTSYYYHIGPCMKTHTDHAFDSNILAKII